MRKEGPRYSTKTHHVMTGYWNQVIHGVITFIWYILVCHVTTQSNLCGKLAHTHCIIFRTNGRGGTGGG